MIRLAAGESLWFEIHEHQLKMGESPNLTTLLWRYREPVSFQHFKRFCMLHALELKDHYRLLNCLMEEEKRMRFISGIADILAWHRILFETIPHMSVTRVEAIELKNIDIIQKLPKRNQPKAKIIFQRFAAVFNEVLPTIELLYECTENPFVNCDKVCDLGDGSRMDENTSIAFSLPSMVSGSDGGDFIHGVCTIKILETLVDCQNEIIEAIKKSSSQKRRAGFKSFAKKVATAASTGPPEPMVAAHLRETPDVPAVNYLTPTNVLQRQLIMYNRERDLLPLLRVFAVQSLVYGEGGMLDYDLQTIQSSIANGLLAGKRAVNLCIRHYQYRGDIKRMGHLENLPGKIEQEALPQSVLDLICAEVDTQDRLARLMQQLEVCIGFIVSVGVSSVRNLNGRTSLSSYVTGALYVPVPEWEEISTASIRQTVYLCHLQSLYLTLEEKLYGNPLDDVLPIFCENLPQREEDLLQAAAPHLECEILLPIFRGFLLKQLTSSNEQFKIDPSFDLKEYLELASGQTSVVSFDEEDWWNSHFPSGIQLRFAKASFSLLKEFYSV